jgi:hypothetical protein
VTGEVSDFGKRVDAEGEWSDFVVESPQIGWATLLEEFQTQPGTSIPDADESESTTERPVAENKEK